MSAIEAQVAAAADAVRQAIGSRAPKVAVVLGSGLGFLGEEVKDAVRVPYRNIPGFPIPTVPGHKGELIAGTLDGVSVLVQSGRFHLYEGHAPEVAALPPRVFGTLGIGTLILTNAAGGIRTGFTPGTLMLLSDHINLMARNPLVGHGVEGEPRFPDMTEPYDAELRRIAKQVAERSKLKLEEGVYAAVLGPSYETKAEINMLERIGADAVGMSTVPEVIPARARGIRCAAISTITNLAAGRGGATLSHAEVLEVAERVKGNLATIVRGIVTAVG